MTEADERRERTRRYIAEQAALGKAHVRAITQAEWDKIGALVADLDETTGNLRPAPEEWSAALVLQHLTLGIDRHIERYYALIGGKSFPTQTPGTLPAEQAPSFAAARERFEQRQAEALRVLDDADPTARLEMTADHGFFGAFNWLEWTAFLHFHARAHVRQIEALRAAIDATKA
jgi:DinB superfamily